MPAKTSGHSIPFIGYDCSKNGFHLSVQIHFFVVFSTHNKLFSIADNIFRLHKTLLWAKFHLLPDYRRSNVQL